jgi:hypothetical protein
MSEQKQKYIALWTLDGHEMELHCVASDYEEAKEIFFHCAGATPIARAIDLPGSAFWILEVGGQADIHGAFLLDRMWKFEGYWREEIKQPCDSFTPYIRYQAYKAGKV